MDGTFYLPWLRAGCLLLLLAGATAAGAADLGRANPSGAVPGLFGYLEVGGQADVPFDQWRRMLRRYDEQMADAARGCVPGHCHLKAWDAFLQALDARPVAEQLRVVNAYFNGIEYVEDSDNYGVADFWATPHEFLHQQGDCEDYAIAKLLSLRRLGFAAHDLRVVVVLDTVRQVGHAVLVVKTATGTYVLDSLEPAVLPIASVHRYVPLVSMNEYEWWIHEPMRTGDTLGRLVY